jgi:hypothetical protein
VSGRAAATVVQSQFWQPPMRDSDQQPPAPASPDPIVELYMRDVDRSLLRQNLRRSIEERIQNLMQLQRFAEELRRAGQRARERR